MAYEDYTRALDKWQRGLTDLEEAYRIAGVEAGRREGYYAGYDRGEQRGYRHVAQRYGRRGGIPWMLLAVAALVIGGALMLMQPARTTTSAGNPFGKPAGSAAAPAPSGAFTPDGQLETFCAAMLAGIKATPQYENVGACMAWIRGEGTFLTINNPLNTTEDDAGVVRLHNKVGVKVYDTLDTGLKATIRTFAYTGHGYEAIVTAMQNNDGDAAVAAIEASDWGTGGIAREVWDTELKAKYTRAASSAVAAPAGRTEPQPAKGDGIITYDDLGPQIVAQLATVKAKLPDILRALAAGLNNGADIIAAEAVPAQPGQPAPAAPAAAPAPAPAMPYAPGKKVDPIPNWQSHVAGRFDSWNCEAWGMQGCIHYGTDILGHVDGDGLESGEGYQVVAPFGGTFVSCHFNGDGGAYIGWWIIYIDDKGGEQLINHFRELGNWCEQPVGTRIEAGALLGTMRGDANHVHMQVRKDGQLVDFERYFAEY